MIVEATDADLHALVAGTGTGGFSVPADSAIAPPEVLEMLRGIAAAIRLQFAPCAWLMVEEGMIAGLCSLTRTPDRGDLHIGYGVAPACEGKSVTIRAIADLLAWARQDARVALVSAETSVENIGSQRVLERNGFVRTGTRIEDEDGELICWSVTTEA